MARISSISGISKIRPQKGRKKRTVHVSDLKHQEQSADASNIDDIKLPRNGPGNV